MRTLATLSLLVSLLFTVACVEGPDDSLDHGGVNGRGVGVEDPFHPEVNDTLDDSEGSNDRAPTAGVDLQGQVNDTIVAAPGEREIGIAGCRPFEANGTPFEGGLPTEMANGDVAGRDRVGPRVLAQSPTAETGDEPAPESDTVSMARRARLRYEQMRRAGLAK